ncbi:MAG: hypothetical protein KGJ43_00375 [Acidobacteriota bacterium]|nr:hypothetical protein [Acidobacteriota bacterium]
MSRGVSSGVARLLGWASTLCCLVVLASFAFFVVNQTNAASVHQQNELPGSVGTSSASGAPNGGATPVSSTTGASSQGNKGTVHRYIDEAAEALRSPFTGLTSGVHSEWVVELVGTMLALFLYGLVLRFVIARTLRVRG